jgi:uncharacterized protein YegJ (DUF2314 family)
MDPSVFIGKWVKACFTEPGTDKKEHLWIHINTADKSRLIGVIDNDPVLKLDVKYGDLIKILLEEIEDCFDGEKNI